MPRYFEIADAIEQLLASPDVLDEHGVLTPEGETQLDQLNAELDAKALDIAAYSKAEHAEAEAISKLAHELLQRAKRHENRAASLERFLRQRLTPGSQRIADARAEISWRKNPAHVEVDEQKLPAGFWRVKTERAPDKVEIAKALKLGQKIEGAQMVPGGYRMEIK